MFILGKQSFPRFAMAIAAFAVSQDTLVAAEPADEGRWFAQVSEPQPVNWAAEGSRRIITHNDGAGNTSSVIRFAVPDGIYVFDSDVQILDDEQNVILDLAGTEWVRTAVIHVTESGSEEIRQIYWLTDGKAAQPALGLTSRTGTDGNVFNCATVMLSQLDDDSFVVAPNGNRPFSLSLGFFQR